MAGRRDSTRGRRFGHHVRITICIQERSESGDPKVVTVLVFSIFTSERIKFKIAQICAEIKPKSMGTST